MNEAGANSKTPAFEYVYSLMCATLESVYPETAELIARRNRTDGKTPPIINNPEAICRSFERIGLEVPQNHTAVEKFIRKTAKRIKQTPNHLALLLTAFCSGIENLSEPICGETPACVCCNLKNICKHYLWDGESLPDKRSVEQKLKDRDLTALTENDLLIELLSGKMNSHDVAVVLQNYGGLRELFTAPYSELLSQPGMTAEAARTLMLVGGIVQKSRTLPRKRGQRISESSQVYSYFESLGDLATEALYAMLLDVQHQLVKIVKIAEGGATKISVNVPDMLREAVATERVRNIILVHNHPSGSTQASVEDMRLTRTVALACQQFDLTLIDHVIIAGDSFSAVKLK